MKNIQLILVIVLTVIAATPASAQKKKTSAKKSSSDMLSMLQGRWSSLDDKKTFFQIKGNRQIDIYGKDILDSAVINFYDECPKRITAEDEQRKSGKYLVVQLKPNDFYCYSVEKISSQQLVLMYLPKGSLLRYKKVPTINLDTYNTPDEN